MTSHPTQPCWRTQRRQGCSVCRFQLLSCQEKVLLEELECSRDSKSQLVQPNYCSPILASTSWVSTREWSCGEGRRCCSRLLLALCQTREGLCLQLLLLVVEDSGGISCPSFGPFSSVHTTATTTTSPTTAAATSPLPPAMKLSFLPLPIWVSNNLIAMFYKTPNF